MRKNIQKAWSLFFKGSWRVLFYPWNDVSAKRKWWMLCYFFLKGYLCIFIFLLIWLCEKAASVIRITTATKKPPPPFPTPLILYLTRSVPLPLVTDSTQGFCFKRIPIMLTVIKETSLQSNKISNFQLNQGRLRVSGVVLFISRFLSLCMIYFYGSSQHFFFISFCFKQFYSSSTLNPNVRFKYHRKPEL